MRPRHVTFTGLDEWTDLDRVLALSRRHPVEWGVLFSPERQGVEPRYPGLEVVGRILRGLSPGGATLAAHLCGGHARAVVAGRPTDVDHVVGGAFARYQVNTAAPRVDPLVVAEAARAWGGTAILQCRGPFPDDVTGVEWLFDASGGRGVTPCSWPAHPGPGRRRVGYAGGLGPDTVAAAIEALAPRGGGDLPCWLDMETAVRTDDRLDLDKCEAVCRVAFG